MRSPVMISIVCQGKVETLSTETYFERTQTCPIRKKAASSEIVGVSALVTSFSAQSRVFVGAKMTI